MKGWILAGLAAAGLVWAWRSGQAAALMEVIDARAGLMGEDDDALGAGVTLSQLPQPVTPMTLEDWWKFPGRVLGLIP